MASVIVSYNDPLIQIIPRTREHGRYAGRCSVPVSGDYDLLLIATAHDEYLGIDLLSYGIPVVDTRNLIVVRNELCYQA